MAASFSTFRRNALRRGSAPIVMAAVTLIFVALWFLAAEATIQPRSTPATVRLAEPAATGSLCRRRAACRRCGRPWSMSSPLGFLEPRHQGRSDTQAAQRLHRVFDLSVALLAAFAVAHGATCYEPAHAIVDLRLGGLGRERAAALADRSRSRSRRRHASNACRNVARASLRAIKIWMPVFIFLRLGLDGHQQGDEAFRDDIEDQGRILSLWRACRGLKRHPSLIS
jgi:hypothetical protein